MTKASAKEVLETVGPYGPFTIHEDIIWCGEIKNAPEKQETHTHTACAVHKSRTGRKTNLFVIGKPEEHHRAFATLKWFR